MEFLLSFSAVSFDNRVGALDGWGWVKSGIGWGGWCRRWQNPYIGHPMSSHDANTMANDTPVGHIVSGSEPRSLPHNWNPPWVLLFSCDFGWLEKCPLEKHTS